MCTLVFHSDRFTGYDRNEATLDRKSPSHVTADVLFHRYTLPKIIKGTHVRNVISGLPYMLYCMHAVGPMVVGDCRD